MAATARLPRDGARLRNILQLWIDESYRAIAPKRLVAQMSAEGPPLRGTGVKRRPASARG